MDRIHSTKDHNGWYSSEICSPLRKTHIFHQTSLCDKLAVADQMMRSCLSKVVALMDEQAQEKSVNAELDVSESYGPTNNEETDSDPAPETSCEQTGPFSELVDTNEDLYVPNVMRYKSRRMLSAKTCAFKQTLRRKKQSPTIKSRRPNPSKDESRTFARTLAALFIQAKEDNSSDAVQQNDDNKSHAN